MTMIFVEERRNKEKKIIRKTGKYILLQNNYKNKIILNILG